MSGSNRNINTRKVVVMENPSVNDYTIPKPSHPKLLWVYGSVVCIGLLTLFVSAHSAFSQVMSEEQAWLAAIVVEAGMIVEAYSAINSHNRFAIVALIFSLGISLTYNYIQAERIGVTRGIDNQVMISVLAIGPILAIVTLSFAFGGEYRKYAQRVAQWELDRHNWLNEEIARRDYIKTKRETTELRMKYGQTASPTIRQTNQVYASDVQDVRQVPTFSRGFVGFVSYLDWLKSRNETFSKKTAIADLGVVERSVDRHIAVAKERGLL
jgi:hypothetical protein